MANSLKEHNFFGFDATVVADSRGINNCRLTTMVVTFPRIVLSEFNTHRMFSRNSASSRAIPFNKMVERVENHPFIPVAWQREHKGMQGSDYFADNIDINMLKNGWLIARDNAIRQARSLSDFGTTKQLANRLLEPFLWHTVIVTASDYENFFALRCPQYQGIDARYYRSWKDLTKHHRNSEDILIKSLEGFTILEKLLTNKSHADIHISLAAEAMLDAYNESEPKELQPGDWHIPFADEINNFSTELIKREQEISTGLIQTIQDIKIKISIATCARISYGNISPADANYLKDIEMYENLKKNRHSSPFEHVAQNMTIDEYRHHMRNSFKVNSEYVEFSGQPEGYTQSFIEGDKGWCDNYRGFISERHKLGI